LRLIRGFNAMWIREGAQGEVYAIRDEAYAESLPMIVRLPEKLPVESHAPV